MRQQVRGKIRLLFSLGFRKFVSGMALGFDMLAAEEVIKLKEELKGVKLVAVVPYRGQSGRWAPYQRERYQRILNEVDEEIVLSEGYYNGCLLKRNDYMLAHASGIIAYYDGKPKGGTFYTCRKARLKGLDIINRPLRTFLLLPPLGWRYGILPTVVLAGTLLSTSRVRWLWHISWCRIPYGRKSPVWRLSSLARFVR